MTTQMTNALRPFLSYYGGKYRLAPQYPTPRHSVIIEPFAGSAGYSVRYPHHKVLLVDKFEKVIAVWKYIIEAKESEILSLPVDIECVDNLLVCNEAKWLIGFWLNQGSRRPCHYPSAWAKTKPNAFWGEQVRARIAAQQKHIRHWKALHASYEDIPDMRATWFVDPPYDNASGRLYKHGRLDHVHLGEWCQRRSGQVIACEAEGATWLPFRPFRETRTSPGKHSKNISKEFIWTNS